MNEWLVGLSKYIAGLNDELEKLRLDNARLRVEVEQWHILTAGIELPEYPITEFQPRDLERGTCHMEYNDEYSNDELYPTIAYECSMCGNITLEGKPNFCRNCGRKVVE